LPDGKIRAEIRRENLLSQSLWLQAKSHRINRRTRLSTLLVASSRRVAWLLRDGRTFMRRPIQAMSSSPGFAEGPVRFPWGISFCDCRSSWGTLRSPKANNQNDLPAGAWAREILPMMGVIFALRSFKDPSNGAGK
jgi:hypothetical protein